METDSHEITQIWGTLSLISGILTILSFLLMPSVSIIFSILAVIFSVIQIPYEFTTNAKIGLCLGILGIIIYLIIGYMPIEGPEVTVTTSTTPN